MALNRSLLGKSYPPITTEVTLDALQKYARAYNDYNRFYFAPSAGGWIIAPPMFNVAVTWPALITALGDPELRVDFLRLLHRSQDMQFLAPIRPGDQISASASIFSIERAAAGEMITIGLDASNQYQQPVSESRFSALIRGRRERDTPAPPSFPARPADSREPLLTLSQTIDRNQTERYAEASGDRNPIHLDDGVAQMAGLPGVIVHGLCTMAVTCKLIVNYLCDCDPIRLKRLAVSFSRPVFPGDTLTTMVWRENETAHLSCFSYETYNSARVAVLRNGLAEIGV